MSISLEPPIRRLQLRDCQDPVVLLALGFGSGCLRPAPGTWGTLAAVPMVMLAHALLTDVEYLLCTTLICVTGIAICGVAAQRLGVHDHPGIVWDEIAGYFVTMLFAPAGWVWLLVGFIAFRLFDILKPWPIRVVDRRVQGGLGIIADDILAGFAALGIVQLVAVLV